MKKILTSAFLVFLGFTTYAQCPANDSTTMGSGSQNDIFYSLRQGYKTGNGTVKNVVNTNWHMAFSVQGSKFPTHPANGVTIRVNSQLGENSQTGATGCKLVKLIGANAANWRSIDTTGLYALPELVDSDSTWEFGAFNSGYSPGSPFNFGWGTYNQTTHDVNGTAVFVLYNKTAGWYKKVYINKIVFDSSWNFIISNIDNTDSNNITLNKHNYPYRLFMYYDVLNNVWQDREPDNRTWDLLWTRYKAMVPFGPVKLPYTVTGVLHNMGVMVCQNEGKKCNEVWYGSKTCSAQDNISTIGYDWKTFTGSSYAITDTFVYFVAAKTDSIFKMTFKSYTGGSQSKSTFSFYNITGIDAINSAGKIDIYPNPANSSFTIESQNPVEYVTVYDMQGRVVTSGEENTIDISNLNNGLYMVLVKTNKGLYQQTLIKE